MGNDVPIANNILHAGHRYPDPESDQMKKTLLALRFIRLLLLMFLAFGVPTFSSAAVFVSVNIPPPALPLYTQPVAPGPGYFWTPGYWAYGPGGYYWVPGAWVLLPFIGALWTPGYWGWGDGGYVWHAGYWGRHVGFYGGVNYGFGYNGVGYQGGRWNNGRFMYNTAVNNINRANIHDTYTQPVVRNANTSRVSYNGGAGGLRSQPTAQDRLAERDQHRSAIATQLQNQEAARGNRGQVASGNHVAPARPSIANQASRTAVTTRHSTTFEHREVGPSQTVKSSHVAHATPESPNPRLAATHASNAGPRPAAGGAPHMQSGPRAAGPSQGGHNGGEHHEEGGRGR